MWMFGYLALLIASQGAIGGLLVGLTAAVLLKRSGLPRRQTVRLVETSRGALRLATGAAAAAALFLGVIWSLGPDRPELGLSGSFWTPQVLLVVLVLGGLSAVLAAVALITWFGTASGEGISIVAALWETVKVPSQLIQSLPYLFVVIVLAGFVGKAIPPRAGGQPYVKER